MGKYKLSVDGVAIAEDRGVELTSGTGISLTPTETEGDHTPPQVTIAGDGVAGSESVAFSQSGTISTTTGAARWYNDTGSARTFVSVRAAVGTAPVGADILVDVNVNGTTIWSTQANRVTITDGANTGESTTFNTATVPDGSYLTVDIDQVGSGTAGADLTVVVWIN